MLVRPVFSLALTLAAPSAVQQHPPPVPVPAAITACSGKHVGDACSFHDRSWDLEGTCRNVPVSDVPVCVPHNHPPPER